MSVSSQLANTLNEWLPRVSRRSRFSLVESEMRLSKAAAGAPGSGEDVEPGSSARLNEICKQDRRFLGGPPNLAWRPFLNTRAQAYPSSFCLHKERLAASSADLAVPKSGLERAESRKRRCETEAVPKKLCRLRGRAEEAVPKRLHVNGFWRAAFGVCANSLSGDAIGAQPLSLPLRQRRGG